MKKKIILGISLSIYSILNAQDSEEIQQATFIENNKTMQAFSFTLPVCNKTVLINNWKNFIKQHQGKQKGGIINKVTGTNLVINNRQWNSSFAYNFNEDNTMSVLTSFYDSLGNFLTTNSEEDYSSIKDILLNFKTDINLTCLTDELSHALDYKNSLVKEQARNISRISSLETILHKDSIQLKNDAELVNIPQKEQAKQQKLRQNIASYNIEKETLEKRNITIEEEAGKQNWVIEDFRKKIDQIHNPGRAKKILWEEANDSQHGREIINENITSMEKEIEGEAKKEETLEHEQEIENLFDR